MITYANGTTYNGSINKDLKSGKGVQTYVDGSSYIGYFLKDKQNG